MRDIICQNEYLPLVSIVIPVYNGSNYLKEAIDSALNQTYSNTEVIVVNDGSCDNNKTERIALSYGDRIRYYYKENGGVSSALNLGIRKMRGEWFCWLSHDDIIVPTKIEKQIQSYVNANISEAVLCCGISLINEEGEIIPNAQKKINGVFSARLMLKYHYFRRVSIYGCSLMIPKSILDECGLFDEGLRAIQDEYYWWLIMSNNKTFVYLNDSLVKARVHKNQQTNLLHTLFDTEREIVARYVLDRFVCSVFSEINLFSYEYFVYHHVINGNHKIVDELFHQLISHRIHIVKNTLLYYSSRLFCLIYSPIKIIYRKYKRIK